MIHHSDPQGSDAWLAARRGVVTASRFRDACDKLKSGASSKACISYAQDVARERVGGTVPAKFQSAAMRTGTEQESAARLAYETQTGALVEEAGFICTDDRRFGVSVDGLIGDAGMWECKTMVSSDTLFTAIVDGDVSAYRAQCVGGLWLLRRQWIDLSLWCPDLQMLHTVRIHRDEAEIQALEDALMTFEATVSVYERALRRTMQDVSIELKPLAERKSSEPAPWEDAAAPPARTLAALPESIFN